MANDSRNRVRDEIRETLLHFGMLSQVRYVQICNVVKPSQSHTTIQTIPHCTWFPSFHRLQVHVEPHNENYTSHSRDETSIVVSLKALRYNRVDVMQCSSTSCQFHIHIHHSSHYTHSTKTTVTQTLYTTVQQLFKLLASCSRVT